MPHPIVQSQLDRKQALLECAQQAQAQVQANPHPDPYLEAYEPSTAKDETE